jgi:hypothetical protein
MEAKPCSPRYCCGEMLKGRFSLALVLLSACGSARSEPDRSAPADAPTAADVHHAAGTFAPALSWGFERASADCNGWPVSGADAIRAAPAHSGSYSCKVCADGTKPGLELLHDVGALPPGHYALTVWVRKRAQTAAPAWATARIDAESSGGTPVSATTEAVPVREEWDLLSTTIDLADGASTAVLTIGADEASADRCLLVDDVTLVRQS